MDARINSNAAANNMVNQGGLQATNASVQPRPANATNANPTAQPPMQQSIQQPNSATINRSPAPPQRGSIDIASPATQLTPAGAERTTIEEGLLREEDITDNMIAQSIENANRRLAESTNLRHIELAHSVHEDTGRVMVQVRDRETGDVVREVPPESRLNIHARLMEMVGLIFDDQA